jgi:hypothetical protein
MTAHTHGTIMACLDSSPFSCFGPVTTSHCRHTMENTNHHSLVVADATAVHGNRDTVLLTIVLLAPLHYTRS